jgi:hypothetical protein
MITGSQFWKNLRRACSIRTMLRDHILPPLHMQKLSCNFNRTRMPAPKWTHDCRVHGEHSVLQLAGHGPIKLFLQKLQKRISEKY